MARDIVSSNISQNSHRGAPRLSPTENSLPRLDDQILNLLTLPLAVRLLFYDTIFSSGHTIILDKNYQIKSSLSPYLSLLQVCHQLQHEVSAYLNSKSSTLLCTYGRRPTILHKIPRRVLHDISVAVIEDSPGFLLNLTLLPNLKCICFTEVWQSTLPALEAAASDFNATTTPTGNQPISNTSPHPAFNPSTDYLPLPPRSTLLPLLPNNTALTTAHSTWKLLRLSHPWIMQLWKTRPDIRISLRRVDELTIKNPPGVDGDGLIYSFHIVVDVASQSIIEKRYLPTRAAARTESGQAEECGLDDHVFEYGAQNWWNLDRGWSRGSVIDEE